MENRAASAHQVLRAVLTALRRHSAEVSVTRSAAPPGGVRRPFASPGPAIPSVLWAQTTDTSATELAIAPPVTGLGIDAVSIRAGRSRRDPPEPGTRGPKRFGEQILKEDQLNVTSPDWRLAPILMGSS